MIKAPPGKLERMVCSKEELSTKLTELKVAGKTIREVHMNLDGTVRISYDVPLVAMYQNAKTVEEKLAVLEQILGLRE